MAKKSLLVIVRHSPYGSSLARSSLEVALTAATYEQTVGVLFMGDGVLHLLSDQDSSHIGARNIARLIASFPLYDLETLYVDGAARSRHGLESMPLPDNIRSVDSNAMQQLFCDYDHLLGF